MDLKEIGPEPADAAPVTTKPQPAKAEPTTTIYARVPWSVGEKLRDIARERSRIQQRRVTVQELVAEAIDKLAS
jgi:hypothetical protein